jgi:hypothetical protein
MDKWEAAEDRQMAENIVALRQEADILRQQGNDEGAQEQEDFIARLPVSEAIKADPQGYLDSLRTDEVSPSTHDAHPEVPAAPWDTQLLPDGRVAIVIGDPNGFAEHFHPQGENPAGYRGTCGVVACEDVLHQFGESTSEADVLNHAVERRLCNTSGSAEVCGGTTPEGRSQILTDFGEKSSVVPVTSLDQLRTFIEDGRGVIVRTNAGKFWNDPRPYAQGNGEFNHAITVTGVAIDPESFTTQGFFVNDSGKGWAGKFISADLMQDACISNRWDVNYAVVTDRRWSDPQ